VYFTSSEVWAAFLVGWRLWGRHGFGERFVLRQVRALFQATEQLAAGDLSARGSGNVKASLANWPARSMSSPPPPKRAREQVEEAERTLLNRALQQTAVASSANLQSSAPTSKPCSIRL
jgi:hypothetical protein